MDPKSGNIYRNARITAGLTQERWAEYLGISPDSVRKYESGEMIPAEDILLMMADISGLKILPYWHLSQKSRIAGEILPTLEEQPALPQAVLGSPSTATAPLHRCVAPLMCSRNLGWCSMSTPPVKAKS